MMDYNLGEKYADKFVSVINEPIYNFDEFSYFGKDALWEPQTQDDLYDNLQNALLWARNAQQSTQSDSGNSTPEQPIESPVETQSNAPVESSVESPAYIQTNKPQYISQIGDFNIDKAINRLHYLTNYDISNNDPKKWTKKGTYEKRRNCARAVRMAMEAGGLSTEGRPRYGGNYGPYLLSHGWKQLPNDTVPQAGDVCVTHGLGKEGWGHISMYDGSKWISDFVQSSYKVFKGTKLGVNTHFYRYTG